jgi:hypothetical protein
MKLRPRYTDADMIETAAWATLSGFLVGALVTAYIAYLWISP